MRTFSLALAHVQRNYVPLLIYAAIAAAFLGLTVLVQSVIVGQYDVSEMDQLGRFYPVVMGVLNALVFAAAQTIAFLRIGADIERPVWKVHEQPGAFIKFFAFWFTLNFIEVATLNLIILSPLDASTGQSLEIFWFLLRTTITPFGACVMFFGNTTRTELGTALHTMLAQLPRMALICLVSLFLSSLLRELQSALAAGFLPALAIVYAYFDCFIFCYCWELCRDQRELEENSDDFNF